MVLKFIYIPFQYPTFAQSILKIPFMNKAVKDCSGNILLKIIKLSYILENFWDWILFYPIWILKNYNL